MPLSNWVECHAGNISAVRIGKKGSPKNDAKYWEIVRDHYIAKFDMEESYKRWLTAQQSIALLKAEYIETRDPFLITMIEIEEAEARTIMVSKGKAVSVDEVLTYLSEMQHTHLTPETVTVARYFTMIDIFEKRNKKQSA